MKALAFVAVLVFVTSASAGAATTVMVPSSKAATAAFGRLLHHRYGSPLHGYWTCPKGQADNSSILCLGEVRSGRIWHQLATVARWSGTRVVFSRFSGTKWVRHWWPYSRHFILRSNEGQVPGVVSVNSPSYDWGFLAECAAGVQKGHTGSCQAYDGDASGWLRFYRFSCSRPTGLVTCANSLGDVMRYTRAATAGGATRLPSFKGCAPSPATSRPTYVLFACGDGNAWVNHLHWSAWTMRSANAVGVWHQNTCDPFCAAGHFRAYPNVSVRLSRPENCSHGRYLFTRVAVHFERRKPAAMKARRFTSSAPFVRHSGCP